MLWHFLALSAMLPTVAGSALFKEYTSIEASLSDKMAALKVDASQLNEEFKEEKCKKVSDAQIVGQPTAKKVSLLKKEPEVIDLICTRFLFSGKIRATFGLYDDKECKSTKPAVFKDYTVDVQNFLVELKGQPGIDSVTKGIEWNLFRDKSIFDLAVFDLDITFNNKMTVTVYDDKDVKVSDRDKSTKLQKLALESIFGAVKKAVGDVYADVMRTQQWIGGGTSLKGEVDSNKIAKLTKSAFDPSKKTILKKRLWGEIVQFYEPIFKSPSYSDICKDDGSIAQYANVIASAVGKSKHLIETEFQVKQLKFNCKPKVGDSHSIKFPEISATVNVQPDPNAQGKDRFPVSCSVVKQSTLNGNENTNVGASKEAIGKMFDDLSQQVAKYACDFALEMIAVSFSNFPSIRRQAFYATEASKTAT